MISINESGSSRAVSTIGAAPSELLIQLRRNTSHGRVDQRELRVDTAIIQAAYRALELARRKALRDTWDAFRSGVTSLMEQAGATPPEARAAQQVIMELHELLVGEAFEIARASVSREIPAGIVAASVVPGKERRTG